jgi:hypothetical protein
MGIKWLVILMLILLPAAYSYGQDSDIPHEYTVKAKYLLNIPRFAESNAKVSGSKSYAICLVGDTPLEGILASSNGLVIKNLPLAVLKVEELSQLGSCQTLFIASSERYRLQTLLSEAHRQGIITIGDMRDFARLGGMIGLLTIDNRIAFELNLSAAGKASISFSTHVFKLARDIIK